MQLRIKIQQRMRMKLIAVMFGVVGLVTSYDMAYVNHDVLVREGSPLNLLCSVDTDYEYCTFTSPNNQECHFEWKFHLGDIKRMSCDQRIKFNGVYKNHQCGITIDKATQADSGKWECSLEDYKLGSSRGKVVAAFINVTVMAKTTTSTTTTTLTTSTTTTTTKNSILGRFVDPLKEGKPSESANSSTNGGLIAGLLVVLILAVFSLILVGIYFRQKRKNTLSKGDGISYLTIVNNEFEE